MTDRELRDVLAECVRRTNIGMSPPAWEYCDDVMREQHRLRADTLIRLLSREGVGFTRRGDPPPHQPSDIVFDGDHQTVRWTGSQLVLEMKGKAVASWNLVDAIQLAGRVLERDSTVKGVANLLTMLAATCEALRQAYGQEV